MQWGDARNDPIQPETAVLGPAGVDGAGRWDRRAGLPRQQGSRSHSMQRETVVMAEPALVMRVVVPMPDLARLAGFGPKLSAT